MDETFPERLERIMEEHLPVLNRLDPHLGCARCSGPLDDGGHCSTCEDVE